MKVNCGTTTPSRRSYGILKPVWIPYLREIDLTSGGMLHIKYKGGEFKGHLDKVLTLMLYGDSEAIPWEILETLARKGIPVIFHRRNLPSTTYVVQTMRPMKRDVLTEQILYRENKIKRRYIARKLLQAKFEAMRWLLPVSPKLNRLMSVKKLREIESVHSRKYWSLFYKNLGLEGETRRGKNFLSNALNAQSKFLAGIVLRWIHFHHLSPSHGFLHTRTEYPSLVYDLLEPYRPAFEYVTYRAYLTGKPREERFLSVLISETKEFLHSKFYCPQTSQVAIFQELLHGVVLSLRSYLLKESKYFVIPTSGRVKSGRPHKVGYKLPGFKAGEVKVKFVPYR